MDFEDKDVTTIGRTIIFLSGGGGGGYLFVKIIVCKL